MFAAVISTGILTQLQLMDKEYIVTKLLFNRASFKYMKTVEFGQLVVTCLAYVSMPTMLVQVVLISYTFHTVLS